MGAPRSVTSLRFDPNFNRQTLQAAKFALTLEHNPRLLLNGARVATFGPRLTAQEDEDTDGGGGGDTVLYVVGGLVALGGLTAILVDEVDEVFEAPLRELGD